MSKKKKNCELDSRYFLEINGEMCYSEPCVYMLACQKQCPIPEIDKFQWWVFGEVLPALRKYGMYVMREDERMYLFDNINQVFNKGGLK